MPEITMHKRIYQIKAKILANAKVRDNYFHCLLQAPQVAGSALPGQFVNIKVSSGPEPLLRRPLSIHRIRGAEIELFFEVVGEGTRLLSQRKPGERLDIIGPLGNGFNYELPVTNYQLPILVAGGMGVAPLVFLAEKLAQIPMSKSQIPIALIGAKTKSQILCEKEFQKCGCSVKIATDDGSAGFKGYVSDLLKKILQENKRTREQENGIYACGPKPMLKEVAGLAKKYRIPAQLSLEEHMACGIGACLGCAVKTIDGYQRVCQEGPVFAADRIVWQK